MQLAGCLHDCPRQAGHGEASETQHGQMRHRRDLCRRLRLRPQVMQPLRRRRQQHLPRERYRAVCCQLQIQRHDPQAANLVPGNEVSPAADLELLRGQRHL